MDNWMPALLALVIASVFTLVELITTKYPRTGFVLTPRRSRSLYVYALIYGLIAFGAILGLRQLVAAEVITLEGVGVSNRWVQAIALGLSAKALLHIRLFSVSTGSQPFPVGVETIVQIFEPWLLRTIDIDEFDGVRTFLNSRADKYTNLNQVRQTIMENVPQSLPPQERTAFIADVEKATTVRSAMELYLRLLGKRSFSHIFP